MSILEILFRNSGQKNRTLRPKNQSVPVGFRGALEHQTELCIGCGACAYVCSPGAITLQIEPGDGICWQYNALRCTYCSRCAEYCPTHAIRLVDHAPAAAPAQQGPALASSGFMTHHLVKPQLCARCGKPFSAIPLPILEDLMERKISTEAGENSEIPHLMRLCEKCRQHVASEHLRDSFIGAPHRKGS
jgi:ferredoxin